MPGTWLAPSISTRPVLEVDSGFEFQWKPVDESMCGHGLQYVGMYVPNNVPHMTAHRPHELRVAMTHRQCRRQPVYEEPGFWPSMEKMVEAHWKRFFPHFHAIERNEGNFRMWWENQPPHKRSRYLAAWEGVVDQPGFLRQPSSKRGSPWEMTMMLKYEKLSKAKQRSRPGHCGVDYAPRVITFGTPTNNVVFGSWHYPFAKMVRAILSDRHPNMFYAIGYDSVGLGQVLAAKFDERPYAVEGDYECYDSTQRRGPMDFSHRLYRKAGISKYPELRHALRQFRRLHVVNHQWRMRAKLDCTMASGLANTSEAGSLCNLFAMYVAVSNVFDGQLDRKPEDVPFSKDNLIVAMGDDSLVLSKKNPADIPDFAAKLQQQIGRAGFVLPSSDLKIRNRFNFTFAASRLHPSGQGHFMGPALGRMLHKFGYSTEPQPDPNAWMAANIYALRNIASATPFLRVLLPWLMRWYDPSVRADSAYERRIWQSDDVQTFNTEVWQTYHEAYGLGPMDEDSFATWLKDRSPSQALSHYAIQRMVAVDVGEWPNPHFPPEP